MIHQELADGAVLKNRYVVQQRIARGETTIVYRAIDKGNEDEVVAIKQCPMGVPEAYVASEHEAQTLVNAKLHHPNLPEIKDLFIEKEYLYLVMAFIAGPNLDDVLQTSREPFAVSDVLDWADQLLSALDYLHSQPTPLIHRDVKPKNLILSPDGVIFLVDFGVTRSSSHALVREPSSLVFAAPEQLYGQGTDARSDIYSLSATLYYLLSRIAPVNANERYTAIRQKKPDPIRPLHHLVADVSPEIAQVVERGMALDPEHRYQSAQAMRIALRKARWGHRGRGKRLPLYLTVMGLGGGVVLLLQLLWLVMFPCWLREQAANLQATVVEIKAKVFGGPPPSPAVDPCPTIHFYGDRKGTPGARLDQVLAKRFAESTCIRVAVTNPPQEERFPTNEILNTHDVIMIDLIWTSALAPYLIDLNQTKARNDALLHAPEIIANNTVHGRLIAMPFFRDVGILYYRTDLLQKHGYSKPPATWEELEAVARDIVAKENDPSLTGFIWQGASYEGATCNALEWLVSSGALGTDRYGQVSFPYTDTERVIQTINRARRWIGTISPGDVLRFTEVESHEYFQSGHAVFMRLWPYAYGLMNEEGSAVRGKFGITAIPHDPGFPSVGVVGGWQIAIPATSEKRQEAVQFLRYITSPEVQRWRATYGYIPTILSLSNDPDVQQHIPFLQELARVTPITRPSNILGEHYPEATRCFYSALHRILLKPPPGDLPSQEILPEINGCFPE